MQLYGGRVVHQSYSDEGVIEVVDLQGTRSLHFGTYPRQSTMLLRMPHRLELTYTQAMMAGILLNPQPKRVLIIGLGGGSLVKFLLYHFPECQIDVVEYRQDVVDVAKAFFRVPGNDPRLNIRVADGYLFVNELFYDGIASYDMILVDAYDHTGMAASVGVQAFFDACAGLLTDDGLMSINLWGTAKDLFQQTMQRINLSFVQRSLILPVENKGNVIAIATRREVEVQQLKQLKPLADELELKLQINLPRALQSLIKQNHSFIRRLFAG